MEFRQASCSPEGDSKGRVTFRVEKSARRSYRVNFIGGLIDGRMFTGYRLRFAIPHVSQDRVESGDTHVCVEFSQRLEALRLFKEVSRVRAERTPFSKIVPNDRLAGNTTSLITAKRCRRF